MFKQMDKGKIALNTSIIHVEFIERGTVMGHAKGKKPVFVGSGERVKVKGNPFDFITVDAPCHVYDPTSAKVDAGSQSYLNIEKKPGLSAAEVFVTREARRLKTARLEMQNFLADAKRKEDQKALEQRAAQREAAKAKALAEVTKKPKEEPKEDEDDE